MWMVHDDIVYIYTHTFPWRHPSKQTQWCAESPKLMFDPWSILRHIIRLNGLKSQLHQYGTAFFAPAAQVTVSPKGLA